MMDFELQLKKPAIKTACLEGIVMGLSYFIGLSTLLMTESSHPC